MPKNLGQLAEVRKKLEAVKSKVRELEVNEDEDR